MKEAAGRLRKGSGNSRRQPLGRDNIMLLDDKLACLAKSDKGRSTLTVTAYLLNGVACIAVKSILQRPIWIIKMVELTPLCLTVCWLGHTFTARYAQEY